MCTNKNSQDILSTIQSMKMLCHALEKAEKDMARLSDAFIAFGNIPVIKKEIRKHKVKAFIIKLLPWPIRQKLGCLCHWRRPYGWVVMTDCKWHDI